MFESSSYEVFIVDDDPQVLLALEQVFMLEDIKTQCFSSPKKLVKALNPDRPTVVITDLNMPELDGLSLFAQIKSLDHNIPVILLTGYGDVSLAVKAIRNGVYDFIEKPFNNEHVLDVVRRAAEKHTLTLENKKLKETIKLHTDTGLRILGRSSEIVAMRELLSQIKDIPADVLIHGDTGTGKELVARFLHDNSPRKDQNFVAINCGAIPEELIESELFGAEAGAYTGANKQRQGKFEYANGGTLFLDEIESTPMSVQIKLLRILEERKVTRVGGHQQINLNLRIVAATKQDLRRLADQGSFRLDLYYRLNLVNVFIPALKQRKDDISILFAHFAKIAAANYHKPYAPLDSDQLAMLLQYDWPGNVRELRNLAERYVLIGSKAAFAQEPSLTPRSQLVTEAMGLVQRVEFFESKLIEEALSINKGRINSTMEYLKLPRKTLYDKMKKFSINRHEFKDDNMGGE
ncbi:sigma-54 dependent transcriptional regulator [Psychrobium sp. 1_MG-2023]|uniref:sigma-54-dependent transcriptional regulator n=1 Tax=Psychrobium sp. 1_MG-2023 TaxID=3062624 RepID=UPI000C33E159|nr:sigma-54 dependent transcriptional regulator [Psychrobium sp. 1_MG-2023]MDP2561149.1 sigma-54 dependent transcriptional regulator [Psychrobium sp. 1_MG-2023]PKF55124.1 DNA-binding response regulator [Alteromonadales bacterium alter-6D02]